MAAQYLNGAINQPDRPQCSITIRNHVTTIRSVQLVARAARSKTGERFLVGAGLHGAGAWRHQLRLLLVRAFDCMPSHFMTFVLFFGGDAVHSRFGFDWWRQG